MGRSPLPMRGTSEGPAGAERRSPYGDLLLAAFVAARRPLSFDDLARIVAPRGAKLSEVAEWLARARAGGVVDDRGFAAGREGRPTGPRLYALSRESRDAIRVDRRRRSGHRFS